MASVCGTGKGKVAEISSRWAVDGSPSRGGSGARGSVPLPPHGKSGTDPAIHSGTLRVASSLFTILQRMSQAVQVLCGLGAVGLYSRAGSR
jgi:hypothetical protein